MSPELATALWPIRSRSPAVDKRQLIQAPSGFHATGIDLIFPERPGKVAEGIYSLECAELKVVIGKTERPTDYTAKAGSRWRLFILKREKK